MVWKLTHKLRADITLARVMRMVEADELEGICIACGADAMNVEPDARHYTCDSCGEQAVYGADEILVTIA